MMRFGSGLAIAVILLGVSPKSSAADAVLALFDDPGASADEIFRYDLTDDTFTEISSSFNWNTVRDITLDSDGNILALFDDPGASADEVFR